MLVAALSPAEAMPSKTASLLVPQQERILHTETCIFTLFSLCSGSSCTKWMRPSDTRWLCINYWNTWLRTALCWCKVPINLPTRKPHQETWNRSGFRISLFVALKRPLEWDSGILLSRLQTKISGLSLSLFTTLKTVPQDTFRCVRGTFWVVQDPPHTETDGIPHHSFQQKSLPLPQVKRESNKFAPGQSQLYSAMNSMARLIFPRTCQLGLSQWWQLNYTRHTFLSSFNHRSSSVTVQLLQQLCQGCVPSIYGITNAHTRPTSHILVL